MKIFRQVLYITLLVVVVFSLSFQGQAADKKIVIRVASPFKAGHILCDAGNKFKELVEQRTNGRIQVELMTEAGTELQVNELCTQGKAEMQFAGGQALQDFAPQYFFFNAPYVMKDFDHFQRVWDGKLGKQAREQIAKNGNQIFLGVVYRGLRQMTSKKPIFTPEDVTGLKLRLPPVPAWIAVWKAMGAEPVPVALPELYNALKDGKAEASEGDLTQIASFKLDEVQSCLTITNHLVQTGSILINKPFFEGLSKTDRELIQKAVNESTAWANDKIKKGETSLYIDLQRKGMRIIIPDAEAFREKGKPAVEELFKKEWPVTTWVEVLAQ